MAIVHQTQYSTVHAGDCLDVLKELPDESVHAVITDPPYGLSNTTPAQVTECLREWASGNTTFVPAKRGGFMGKDWDSFVPPPAVWEECYRVLKPGGHLLAFAGSRTQDLMGMSVRLAGFDIRDNFAWLYGSGFPKSMDVSKAIDKGTGQNKARQYEFTAWMRSTGITARQINEATGTNMGGHYLTDQSQPAIATADLFDKLRPLLPEVPEQIERLVAERTGIEWTDYVKRKVVGVRKTGLGTGRGTVSYIGDNENRDITASHSPEAQQWEGWGTALKPAFEPVIMARKPFTGTVAANVLEHGTGAINVDATRVGLRDDEDADALTARSGGVRGFADKYVGGKDRGAPPTDLSKGRWPANVVLDESQAEALDEQSGALTSGGGNKAPRKTSWFTSNSEALEDTRPVNSGGASRFFYCAKAPKSERPKVDGTAHPTVKPLTLLRHLVRMVTPPGGTVLDPFAGSGTTLEAATQEGFTNIGIEAHTDYLPLIAHRLERTPEPEETQPARHNTAA